MSEHGLHSDVTHAGDHDMRIITELGPELVSDMEINYSTMAADNTWLVLRVGPGRSAEAAELLGKWRRVLQAQLPSMQAAHICELVDDDGCGQRCTHHVLLCNRHKDVVVVLGGATFALCHDVDRREVVLECIVLATDELRDVRGKGAGTRLVNVLKSIASDAARHLGAEQSTVLTQSDAGRRALAFWQKQGLQRGAEAKAHVSALCTAHPSVFTRYLRVVPMVSTRPARAGEPWLVEPSVSSIHCALHVPAE